MIVQGKLFVEGEVRNILAFDLLFEQGTDWSGKPCRRPQLEGVFIELESTKNDELFHHWITSNHAMKQGKIIFYGPDGMKEWRKYEFWDCVCVSWKEEFRHNTTDPMDMKLKLIPAIFKTPGGTIAEKNWKVSDPFTQHQSLNKEEEEEPGIISTYWMDENAQKQLERSRYGANACLYVKTENINPGEKITITIKDGEDKILGTQAELFYSGTVDDDGTAILRKVFIDEKWENT